MKQPKSAHFIIAEQTAAMMIEGDIKRWTSQAQKHAVAGRHPVRDRVPASRQHELWLSGSKQWVDDGKWVGITFRRSTPPMCAGSTSASFKTFKRRMARRCWNCRQRKRQSLLDEGDN